MSLWHKLFVLFSGKTLLVAQIFVQLLFNFLGAQVDCIMVGFVKIRFFVRMVDCCLMLRVLACRELEFIVGVAGQCW